MKPTRVPDDLLAASFDAIRAWYVAHSDHNSYLDDRTQMRIVLAAALTLHDQRAEEKLRAALGELERLRAQRDWQPGRWHQVRRPDGSLWMETSDREEAEVEARKQGWPLYRLWECRETEWRSVADSAPQQPESGGAAPMGQEGR